MLDGFFRITVIAVLALLSGCGIFGSSRHNAWVSDIPIGGLIQPPEGMSPQQAVAEVTARSVLLLGTPYRPGGMSPSQGMDCSGLVAHVVQDAFRLRFPRTAEDQAMIGVEVPRRSLAPGDLVFFNTSGRSNSHVGVYLGDDQFVHAPTSNGVVRIDSLEQEYWARRFEQARRMIAAAAPSEK